MVPGTLSEPGHMTGAVDGPMAIVDHGDITATNYVSGASMGSLTSTGDYSVLLIGWEDGSTITPSACTIGGQAMTLAVSDPGGDGSCIFVYEGALSGNVVMTHSGGTISAIAATLVSLTGPLDMAVIDTDVGTNSLAALSTPGDNGTRIVVSMDGGVTNQTFTGGVTELTDIGVAGFFQHAAAYSIADSSGAIGNSLANSMCGVSIG